MSRIGKLPINIPAGVEATLKDNVVTVKGPKGELSQAVDPSIIVTIADGQITFAIDENSEVEQKQKQAFHGLYRALVNNMVVGVTNKNPYICLTSCDKQLLGLVCAKIRSFRKPEPYKGKGILYVGEQIRRKSGKSAGAK